MAQSRSSDDESSTSDDDDDDEDDTPLAAFGNRKRIRSSTSSSVKYNEDSDDDDDDEEAEFDEAEFDEEVEDDTVATGGEDDDAETEEEEDDSDDDDFDDAPLSSLKSPSTPTKRKRASQPKKSKPKPKKKSKPKPKPKPKKKKKQSTPSTPSSSTTLITPSSTLYTTSIKGRIIQSLLCRWWYAITWPNPSHLPNTPPPNCDPLDGFPGVYVHTSGPEVGKIVDYRDEASCPNFKNMSGKGVGELVELLLKAIEGQRVELRGVEGEGTGVEVDLGVLERWVKKVNVGKADREAVKVLKAAGF